MDALMERLLEDYTSVKNDKGKFLILDIYDTDFVKLPQAVQHVQDIQPWLKSH